MPTGVYERKPMTAEHRQAISDGRKGMQFSEEHRQNLSDAKKGIPSPQKGCKRTPEQCARIGDAHLGQVAWNKGTKGLQVAWNKGIKTGVVPWNKGLSQPSELKARIAKTLKDKRDKQTPHSIYYLIDPVTLIPRYVGFSEKPEKRFEGHVKHLRGSTHKATWIKSLLNIGLRPTLSIRCIVASKLEACRIETALIALLRARGVDLTNATLGGEGGATMTGRKRVGKPWTAEQRTNHMAALTPEVKAAAAAATRAGWAKRNGAPTKRAGKAWSEKQRIEITRAKSTPEAIQRSRDAQIGKVASEATRENMRLGQQRRREAEGSVQPRWVTYVPDSQVTPIERLQRQLARSEKKLAKLKAQFEQESE